MATGAMKSGVQLDDDESRVINKATAKAMRISLQDVKQIPDNVTVWIDTYNNDPERISLWIKSRLSGATKPHQYSVLEHLMISHRDWNDMSHQHNTQSKTNQSSAPQDQSSQPSSSQSSQPVAICIISVMKIKINLYVVFSGNNSSLTIVFDIILWMNIIFIF